MDNKTKDLITNYKQAIDLMYEVDMKYKKINSLDTDINRIKDNFTHREEELHYKIIANSNNTEKIVKRIIRFGLAIIICILFIKGYMHNKIIPGIEETPAYTFSDYFTIAFDSLLLFAIFQFVGKLPAYIIYNIFGNRLEELSSKKYTKEQEKLSNERKKANNEISKINMEIEQLNKEIESKQKEIDKINLGNLHNDYKNYYALTLFVDYLEKGRCDSIKECINLYEHELKENERNNQIQNLQSQVNRQIGNVRDEMQSIRNKIEDVNSEIGGMKDNIKDINSKASKSLDLAETEAKIKTEELTYEYGREKLRQINNKNYK
ncbi:MAG: hypothetical protein IJ715_04610 [Bacilli bacterium]|nr:hypothetical protein [Bacilli bacterium]